MKLKSEIEKDCCELYMDLDDFAEWHLFNGKKIPCVVDDESLKERQGTNELGIEEASLLIFTPVIWVQDKKKPGDIITYDGKTYVVVVWNVNAGMNEIALKRNS